MNLKKPFLDRICDASPLFLPYANLSVDEANNQEAGVFIPDMFCASFDNYAV